MNCTQRIANWIGYRLIDYGSWLHALDIPKDIDLLRTRYNLTTDSFVVDVGGYTGDWASMMFCRYACNIDIYEPHPTLYHHALKELFRHNGMVRIFGYGLSDKSEKMTLYGDGYVSSLYPMQNTMNHQIAEIRKASDVFNERYSNKVIDVLKINVEGAEYEILPDLIQNYDMSKIRNIQIQFHQVVDGYAEKREKIQHDLAALGFVQTWNVEWAFENWENV
jgi:FkbM family methyltransferase